MIYVSATPGLSRADEKAGVVVEQVIRPTGLWIRQWKCGQPAGRWTTCPRETGRRTAANERVLVTTLTKRMSEDLAEYFSKSECAVPYLHSEVSALERSRILRDLRRGEYDVLIGVNLLREGLDLPEVTSLRILDLR